MPTSTSDQSSRAVTILLGIGITATVTGIGIEFGTPWALIVVGALFTLLGITALFAHLTATYLLRDARVTLEELKTAANKLPSDSEISSAIQDLQDHMDALNAA